jgi:5-methylcytosine-specific restriction endonuclease McrBC GTP-binding regulatory subunit McrB
MSEIGKKLAEIGELLNEEIPAVKDSKTIEKDKLPPRSPRVRLKHPLNKILYGAPGTGKTYATAEYAMAILENRDVNSNKIDENARKILMANYKNKVKDGHIVFTTFHQSYGYEDFVQGLRPDPTNSQLSFETIDGVFKKIADNAMQDMNNDYVLIIDEINRAQISKVFGELITLIEDDKRWGEINELSVTLPYGDVFSVPNNLYILGTMNSADKSISLIDTALRRRFEFIEVIPNKDLVDDIALREVLERINKSLANELDSTDLLIGHAYFIKKSETDLCNIMNRNIIPLLYEYFFDDSKKVRTLLSNVIDGHKYIIVGGDVGRLKIQEVSRP